MSKSTQISGEPAGKAPASARSPFARLHDLLHGHAPGADPIDMSVGGPRHPFPAMVGDVLARELGDFSKYPPARGTKVFRAAVGAWLDRRYRLGGRLDADTSILPLAGSREGLFLIAFIAADRARMRGVERPAILVPNPFYQTYAAAVEAAGCEAVYLPATSEHGFLPDFRDVPDDIRARLAAIYLCSPANPQGSVASLDYWRDLIAFARHSDAVVLADECYSEIYRDAPAPGALEAADGRYDLVLTFNSLSKRSNLPGLRAGFVAGDPALIGPFFDLRNVAAPTVPVPVQTLIAELYGDEAHVGENRALYNAKFARAADILGGRYGHTTPEGGFFLWLDLGEAGGGEAAALQLWQEAGLKVVPGGYLTMPPGGGPDPGAAYVRLALVGGLEETETALTRLRKVIG